MAMSILGGFFISLAGVLQPTETISCNIKASVNKHFI
jgi:hypothetical protein